MAGEGREVISAEDEEVEEKGGHVKELDKSKQVPEAPPLVFTSWFARTV